jgi:hypothetical protein
MWILNSPTLELSFIYIPGLLGIIIGVMFPHLGNSSFLYALLAMSLIDSGHVYTTFWRTYFHKRELISSKRYVVFPVLSFLLFFGWNISSLPGLWKFVVYSTLFHHVRQVYGLSKWYQSLNKRSDKISDFFLYSLSILPIITYHFRPGAISHNYTPNDLFLFPNIMIAQLLMMLFFGFLLGWIFYERSLWKNGVKERNRVISIAYPTIIYSYCFFIGETLTQVLFPLLFVHGISYLGIMGIALKKTQKIKFSSFSKAIFVIILTATTFGIGEAWIEQNILDLSNPSFLNSLFIGIYLTPLFCHYYFDSVIWKKDHRESKDILTAP